MSSHRSESGNDRQTAPESQTHWAFERTKLAKERTLAAWLRTGLAIVAGGFAIAKVMPTNEPQWLIHAISVLFILLGCMTFAIGFYSYLDLVKKFEREGYRSPLVWLMGFLTGTLLLGAIGALILVFIE